MNTNRALFPIVTSPRIETNEKNETNETKLKHGVGVCDGRGPRNETFGTAAALAQGGRERAKRTRDTGGQKRCRRRDSLIWKERLGSFAGGKFQFGRGKHRNSQKLDVFGRLLECKCGFHSNVSIC